MTDNNWNNVKNNKKKNVKEEEYILSNILSNGGCIRCMNRSCTINENHGIVFPEKICTFVQNPTYINGIEKSIQTAKLDFNGKKPFYTTCNYTNRKCRNCEEGRIKYITFNNEKIALCYPSLEVIRFKVTVGLHIDIKLILKGTKYEVSALPIIPFINIIEEKKIDNSYSEENWPTLYKDSPIICIKSPILDFSHIEKNFHESKEEINEIKEVPKNINIEEIQIEENAKIKDLIYQNNYLKKENKKLLNEIKILEEKNKREMFIINNQHKYDEILDNVKFLNTRITQQFFETNYEQYVLI